MDLKKALIAFLELAKNAGCRQIVVAYSGGIDSHVLLSLLKQLNQGDNAIPLVAVYINHNIHQDANKWGAHCQSICQSLSIPFTQIEVQAKAESGESQEEKARLLRYRALGSVIQISYWLVTAQHLDDQAETVLLQLMRGSGVDGLSAMPMSTPLGKGEHHRPLLNVSKRQIEDFGIAQQLQWIVDPSNLDEHIPRNYLRKTVLPQILKIWPQAIKMLGRSAKWMAESAEISAEVARSDLAICADDEPSINILEFKKLSHVRQKNLLRYWFHSLMLRRPGEDKLRLIFDQIIDAREDSEPLLNWQGICLRRYRDRLYLLPDWPEENKHWQMDWDLSTINLSENWATLEVKEVSGEGLSVAFTEQPLVLQLRKGGEYCQPSERAKSRSLKKLFQEYSVPPWLRNRWPLLYSRGQLIAVPGLFICKGYTASSSEKGLSFSLICKGIKVKVEA